MLNAFDEKVNLTQLSKIKHVLLLIKKSESDTPREGRSENKI